MLIFQIEMCIFDDINNMYMCARVAQNVNQKNFEFYIVEFARFLMEFLRIKIEFALEYRSKRNAFGNFFIWATLVSLHFTHSTDIVVFMSLYYLRQLDFFLFGVKHFVL